MEAQNFGNHRKFKPTTPSHKLFYLFVVCLNLLAMANLYHSVTVNSGRLNAVLFVLVGITFVAAYLALRSFSLKAQDRAIRAEENLRHFVLTGKPLDKSLKMKQIIALRFAPDDEFLVLTERAIKENLSNTAIKEAIKNWKGDNHRA